MISHFYFDEQLRRYMLQFAYIFSGLQVQTGIGECDVPEMIDVPIVIGNKDRVVAAINAGNTQNRVFSLPAASFYLSGLELRPERRKAPGYVDQKVTLKAGGVFPDDLTTVKRAMPIPYDATMELTLWASNTMQMHQMLEQILVLFNPSIELQVSEGPFDWTGLTTVELTGITNEENYPSGQDRRTIQWTLTFNMPLWLSVPMSVKNDLVRNIKIRISDLSNFSLGEVDENGNLLPFGTPLAEVNIDHRDPVGPIPYQPEPLPDNP